MHETPRDFESQNLGKDIPVRARAARKKFPPIELYRTFNAPVERLWNTWSQPALTKKWWGPEGYTCPYADIDFRVGGRYLLAMRDGEGKETYSAGIYEQIIPYRRIVCSEYFSDRNANPVDPKSAGMRGNWPATLTVTIEFTSFGKQGSRLELKHEGIPPEMAAEYADGWKSSLEKLGRIVERGE